VSYSIRTATTADLDALVAFFRTAYGAETVFQDPGFLRWWFGDGNCA
jgi:hypothetical protein